MAAAICASLAICAVAALAAGPDDGRAASAGKRPNIVVIVTDDQAAPWANKETMPRLLRHLRQKGTRFTQAVASTPECCPSRATMLTGQYAHNNGVPSNAIGYLGLQQKRNTLPVWLREQGYYTAHLGKYLNRYFQFADDTETAPGWLAWHTALPRRQGEFGIGYRNFKLVNNGDVHRYRQEYLTEVLTRKAVKIVRKRTKRRPLYLQVDHFAPHFEHGGEGPCANGPIPERDADLQRFADEPLPDPPSLNEADVSDKPSFIQARAPLSADALANVTRTYRCQLATLRAVDRSVGRIVTALKDAHELQDTAFVFTSDNGFFRGEHRLGGGKYLGYEESARVPMIVRMPAGTDGPKTIHQPVANTDLAPTILELARAEPCRSADRCRTMDGRSLVPALTGGGSALPANRGILLEAGREDARTNLPCQYAGVRTSEGSYFVYPRIGGPDGVCVDVDERELYDLAADPFQLENLFPPPPNSPADDLRDELVAKLATLRDCAGVEGRDPLPPSGHYCE